jgi:hypothetical protein
MLTRFTVFVIFVYGFILINLQPLNAQNAPVTTIATVGNAVPGTIQVPLTVTGFNNIGAISLSIDYDYSVIHFLGGTPNPALPSFPTGEIDLGSGYHRISMGWFGAGVTLSDGSTIMTLNFTYISGIAEIAFYDNGPSCEYADADFNVLTDTPQGDYYINGHVCGPVGNPGAISGNTSVCAGQSGEIYSVAPIANATGYIWDVQDGAVITNGENTNAITVDFGYSAVSGDITVKGSNPCSEGPSSALTVAVNEQPDANAGNDTTINYGTVAYLHADPGGNEDYTFHWSPEELLVDPDVQNPQTVILDQTSIFTVSVNNQATFCHDSDQVTVTITGGPLSVNPVAVPASICLGGSSQLFSNAGGGSGNYSYVWTSIPPQTPPWSSTEANPMIVPDSSRAYHLVVNDGFTTVSDVTGVLVSGLPTATISGGDTLCGDNVHTDLKVDLTGTPPWSFTYSYGSTTVFISGQETTPYYIIASDPGDYAITAVEDAHCSGSSYGTAIVRKYPVPAKPEITVYFTELISSSCCGNQWYRDGAIIPGATGQTYQVTVNGEYFVVVTINGCSSEPSDSVDMIVGISENLPGALAYYPNPADDKVNILLSPDQATDLEISMFSPSGSLLKRYTTEDAGSIFTIDVAAFAPGMYFLVISSEHYHAAAKIIIK